MDFVNEFTHDKLRDEQATYAFRALIAAAMMTGLRAVILPILIAHTPPNTFPGVDAETLRLMGVGQAFFFGLLALWARKDPLPPALAALVCFVGLSVPDILNNSGVLAQGLISKFVMLLILGRALMAGVLHRVR
jgi:hypothetical protein